MRNEAKIIIGVLAVSLLLVIGAAVMLGKSPSPTPSDTTKVDTKLLVKANSNVIGPASAKVTVVEFGDYECPACGAAYPEVKKITDMYGDKIRFVFRNFPLSQHLNAKIAAAAAEAAGKQGKYWQMHDKLYGNQLAWGNGSDPSKDDAVKAQKVFDQFAKDLGLNLTQFDQDMGSSAVKSKISGDQDDGFALSIQSTPTFFINGIRYSSVMTADQMKQVIDADLKK